MDKKAATREFIFSRYLSRTAAGFAILWGAFLSVATSARAFERNAVFLYTGPATGTALLEIIKFQVPVFDPYWAVTAGYARTLLTAGGGDAEIDPAFSLEIEGNVSKHSEVAGMWSFAGAVVVRWHRPPWYRLIDSSFAFGNGLSYATEIPYTEILHATLPSQTLYHLLIEYEVALSKDRLWRGMLRIHHRSGVFGAFGGAVGGSDYVCLGVRRRF